jgi:hypothetical protein
MSTVYACPPRPEPPPVGEPLVHPLRALQLVAALLHPCGRPETAVIWLAADRTGLGCVVVEDIEDPEEVVHLVRALAAACTEGGPAAAVVLATHRPGWGPEADTFDECAFDEAEAVLAKAGVELVDWFLVDEGEAVSMAEHLGLGPRWKP